MIDRIAALLLVVCLWRPALIAQDSGQLERRLRLVDDERSRGHLAAAEPVLAALEAEIERTRGDGILLASALREHGLLCDDRGWPERAIPFYERAAAILRDRPDVNPSAMGVVLANLAGAHVDAGDFDLGLSFSAQAVRILRDREPSYYAVALFSHGIALHGLSRNTEALRDLREALDIWHRAEHPDSGQLALVNEALGTCLAELGFGNQSDAFEQEALAIRGKAFGEASLPVALSLNNMGVLLTRRQRYSEAERLLVRAASIFEQFGADESHRLTRVLGNLGAVYCAEGRNNPRLYAKAEQAFRRELALEEQAFGSSDVRVSATLEWLGEVLYRERAYNEAGRTYGRGLAIQQAALGSSDPATVAAARRYQTMAKKMRADAER